MADTPFVETEALLALLNNDRERVVRLIRSMTPNERYALYNTLGQLRGYCDRLYTEPVTELTDD